MKKLFAVLFFFVALSTFAQVGGRSIYGFMTLPSSARVSALGGMAIAHSDGDVAQIFSNPSLLNDQMSGKFSLGYTDYLSDLKLGNFTFAQKFKKVGTIGASVQYINYGNFTATDPNGVATGRFQAQETAIQLSAARDWKYNIRLGGTLKFIKSGLESYVSTGLAMDLGATWNDTANRQSLALVVTNFGAQLRTYNGIQERLPYDLQLGYSKRLAHLPLRYGIVLHHLYQWDIRYNDTLDKFYNPTTQTLGSTTTAEPKNYFFDKAFRHVILNAEFQLSKNLYLRMGYNHQRRRELEIQTKGGMNGFTWGFGFKVNRFHLSYSRSAFSLASVANQFTIQFNLADFR